MRLRPAMTSVMVSLLWVGTAYAGRNYFFEYDLENCRVYRIGKKSYEFCAISSPAGEKRRAFSLTVRDPSALDTRSKAPGALQEAKHKLIAKQTIPAGEGEYMHYELTAPIDLSDSMWIVNVPLVKGTPGDYDVARSLLYLFNGRKFSLAFESPACSPKCKGQDLQTEGKAGSPEKTVLLIQRLGDARRTTEFKWNGKKLTKLR